MTTAPVQLFTTLVPSALQTFLGWQVVWHRLVCVEQPYGQVVVVWPQLFTRLPVVALQYCTDELQELAVRVAGQVMVPLTLVTVPE